VLWAPWVPVTFAANLMGDVWTSFTRPLTDLLYSFCYVFRVVAGRQYHHDIYSATEHCHEMNGLWFSAVILSLPYIIRLLQCARRFRDDPSDWNHLANVGKYSCSIAVAAAACVAPNSWLWIASYTIATIYACVWDFKMDWGLYYQNRSLERTQQMYPPRAYTVFAGLNILGRSTWALSTLTPNAITGDPVSMEVLNFCLSAFEIYRRAQWVILRVEHEHLTNSSRYRTLCWVPPLVMVDGNNDKQKQGSLHTLDASRISILPSRAHSKESLHDKEACVPLLGNAIDTPQRHRSMPALPPAPGALDAGAGGSTSLNEPLLLKGKLAAPAPKVLGSSRRPRTTSFLSETAKSPHGNVETYHGLSGPVWAKLVSGTEPLDPMV